MTSSLVSFSKRDITETIPGMQIGIYNLPTSKEGTILHVEDSHYYKPDIEGNNDLVAVSSADIVRSVVHMHVTSQLEYSHDKYPALFCIPNRKLDHETLRKEFSKEIQVALAAQRKWFLALVRLADDDWQRLRNHRMISDIQRIAARDLGLKREYLVTLDEERESGCPFCGSNLLDINAPICPSCGRVHNPDRLKALELKLGATTVKEPVNKQ